MRKWLQRARPEGLVLQRLSASLANEFAPDPSNSAAAAVTAQGIIGLRMIFEAPDLRMRPDTLDPAAAYRGAGAPELMFFKCSDSVSADVSRLLDRIPSVRSLNDVHSVPTPD